MVKSRPRISDRAFRRLHRIDNRLRSRHRFLLKLASFSPSFSSPPPPPPPPPQESHPTSSTTQETAPPPPPMTVAVAETVQKSPATPASLSTRRRTRFKKQRSRTPASRSSSSKALSFSSSPSLSCSSSSPRISNFSPLNLTPSPASPLPPLPPQPSPELLRRSASDPIKLLTHLSGESSCSPMKSSTRPVSRNLMGQLPPLPPSSPSNHLRRTISDPIHLQGSATKEEEKKRKMKEQAVEAERLSGEWIVVKFSCECGKDGHYLVNASDKKYFKLI